MADEDFPLDAVEMRVLGALAEKELTTPDYYPLTLNALTLACNQSSNREPVVSYDEATVQRALDRLREKHLAFLFGGAQSRVPRFGHKLSDVLVLERDDLALLCVLLLRGPQTVGELRGRTGRMHEFASLEEVEARLDALAQRVPRPWVVKLPRQPGTKEPRYAHNLGYPPTVPVEPAPSVPAAPPPAAPAGLEERVTRLEQEIAILRQELTEFRRQFQ